ncbi:MAG: tRNA (N(6)-L-threonylcarbamoyladenosine(37)-C(2))-methylthiotransferase [Candidatus Bathyarchaeia archaeon]
MAERWNVYVESHGCSANFADGEAVVNALLAAGHSVTHNPQDADYIIYNTCAVKGPAEKRMLHLIRKTPCEKKTIVTGCLPAINPRRLRETKWDGIVGAAPGLKVLDILNRVNRGERPFDVTANNKPNLSLFNASRGNVKRTIPIAYGCLSKCSFCAVPIARGSLRSYEPTEIVNQVKIAIGRGTREIWLTATDAACYGWDIGSNLPELIVKVTGLPGKFLVRVGMMNPLYVKRILQDLIEAYKSEKVYKFIHLPLQSGCSDVLRSMGRGYTAEEFSRIVSELRAHIQPLTLSTDIICGFPTEGEESFQKTLDLLEEIRPDVVNVSKFEARPGTAAAKLDPLHGRIVKERSTKTSALARQIALKNNQRWINWEGEVLVDEHGKRDTWMGRNMAYKPLVLRSNGIRMGSFVSARIVDASASFLEARIAASQDSCTQKCLR